MHQHRLQKAHKSGLLFYNLLTKILFENSMLVLHLLCCYLCTCQIDGKIFEKHLDYDDEDELFT